MPTTRCSLSGSLARCGAFAIFLTVHLTSLLATSSAVAADPEYDVVVYGATSAGAIAAIQAAEMDRRVVLVGPDQHVGGLTSGGLGWTDSGRKSVIGGQARAFYQRIKQHYDQPSAWRQQKPEAYSRYRPGDDAMWVFEPHVAERVFEDMLSESKVPVILDAWLDREGGVELEGRRITAIRMLDGRRLTGKVFIDATYEGDLMAAAGVPFTVGREANSQYGETLNGVQTARATKHQFDHPIDPYVVPGDPSSGLLPRIHAEDPGRDGQADHRVQAYCYRMCLTNAPENRVPFPKPTGYDPQQYELLARYLDVGWRGIWTKFDPAPNRKTDTNNHGAFSTDNIGMSYDYPTASYAVREEILQEHRDYQQGLMWFLANDPRVPADVRQRMAKWGLAKDEFVDSGHWPHQIYVREARRMVSDFVMTEWHLRGKRATPKPIGMGSYNMDSHNVQRYVDANGHARNEGDIQVNPGGPYPISYEAIIPPKDACTNLLVPVCLSSSHIAYGSIRMEPVFMILGQSAATAADQAIEAGLPVQAVDYEKLSERLLADGQVLAFDPAQLAPTGIRVEQLAGIVVDDGKAELKGDWALSQSVKPYVERGYLHDQNQAKGSCVAEFSADLPPGRYEVRIGYTPNPNRARNVGVKIEHADGVSQHAVDQRQTPKIDRLLQPIGTFRFAGPTRVTISNQGTEGYVVIDCVQFVAADKTGRREEAAKGTPAGK